MTEKVSEYDIKAGIIYKLIFGIFFFTFEEPLCGFNQENGDFTENLREKSHRI